MSRGWCRPRRPGTPTMSLRWRQLFLLFLLFLLLFLDWTWRCTDWFQVCGWCLSLYISAIGSRSFIQTKLNGTFPWIVFIFLSIGGFVAHCYHPRTKYEGRVMIPQVSVRPRGRRIPQSLVPGLFQGVPRTG